MKPPRFVKHLLALFVICALGIAVYGYRNVLIWVASSIKFPGKSVAVQGHLRQDFDAGDIKVIADGLSVPWEIGFLPDGSLLATERTGMLKRIAPDGTATGIPIIGVKQVGEGGLLGLAVHPQFARNGWIYLYQTGDTSAGLRNRIDRYRLDGDRLADRTTILQNIPASRYHDGGALAFGPDGKLYATTGDAERPSDAQDLYSLSGKILRLNDDGTIPNGNPFDTAVWSYGHRDPEGLAWDAQGRLWATEHGRSGVLSGLDELNLIEPGANYGWPTIQGDEKAPGMRTPMLNSGPDETWAPAGLAFYSGSLIFGGLRGEALYQAKIDANPIVLKANFEGEYGRIRAVAVSPDGLIYFSTSNTDGRGLPKAGDDKIISVNPRLFR